MSFKLS